MKQKHLDYLAPEAEILVVRFEGVVCASKIDGWSGNPVSSTVWGDDLDDNGME